MSVRFKQVGPGQTGGGNVLIDSNVISATVTLSINWADDQTLFGDALGTVTVTGSDGQTYSADTPGSTGSTSITFPVSRSYATEYNVLYQNANSSNGTLIVASTTEVQIPDNEIVDGIGAVIYLSASNVLLDGGSQFQTEGPSSCPDPESWYGLGVPSSCPSPPTLDTNPNGLQVSLTGPKQVTLNLRNYPNKLVSLKMSIFVKPGTAWTQLMNFNIPQASDIIVNGSAIGGLPYSKSSYVNSNVPQNLTIFFYNLDGGDYNYVFNHDSITPNLPTRTNYNLKCTSSTSTQTTTNPDGSVTKTDVTTTTCVCEPYIEAWGGIWPVCSVGVAIFKNGGNVVRWAYEDGGGGTYDDQFVTLELIGVRDVIPLNGTICTSTLKDNLWIPDPEAPNAQGNCISNYKDHSDKRRFRNPAARTSLTTINSPVCYSSFRGFAGALPPA